MILLPHHIHILYSNLFSTYNQLLLIAEERETFTGCGAAAICHCFSLQGDAGCWMRYWTVWRGNNWNCRPWRPCQKTAFILNMSALFKGTLEHEQSYIITYKNQECLDPSAYLKGLLEMFWVCIHSAKTEENGPMWWCLSSWALTWGVYADYISPGGTCWDVY